MHGRERLGRHYGEWLELFEDIRTEASGFVDVGERVIARVHFSARSKSTGMPLAIDYAVVHELDASGRIAAGREYATEAEAIHAAEAADAGHVSPTTP
jgi:ketosteroid isomerase-like protein